MLCSGCIGTSLPKGPEAPLPVPTLAAAAPVAPRAYLLQAGDSFDVKLFYTPELNESLVVRPDGKVSLQLIGELQAAGLTTAQLEDELRTRYAKQLRDPSVTVIVKTFSPPRVYVVGEVHKPGELPFQENMSALQAIARSGFFTRDAEARTVALLRYQGSNGPEFKLLNMKGMIDGEPGAQGDVLLQAQDVVFVPQTEISSVADFFNRYFNNIIPLWRNIGFSAIYYTNGVGVNLP